MLEAASEDESGGNSRFAGGVMRFAYDVASRICGASPTSPTRRVANSDFGTNTPTNSSTTCTG